MLVHGARPRMWPTLVLGMLSLGACHKGSVPDDKAHVDSGNGGGTGNGDDTGPSCSVTVLDTTPTDGESDFYWRDSLAVSFSDVANDLATMTLLDGSGAEVATSVAWDEGGFQATVVPDAPLEGDADYTFQIDVCDSSTSVAFHTSRFGLPLEVDPSSLVGLTYDYDLAGATYTKPEGLGTVVGTMLSAPLLVGITAADNSSLTLMGAQGKISDTTGEISQDTNLATWDLGTADFTESPFFSTDADEIDIDYDGSVIPIYNFHVEGTFSSDASVIGGGEADGLADTRNMAPIFNSSDPNVVCNYATSFGLSCTECPDGETYCMEIQAYFEPAPVVDGLTLEPVSR